MFSPSTIAVSAAIGEIADSAGASGDAESARRALRSLNAGIKYFNGKENWFWLLTEAAPINVIAPFSVAITASAGQASASAVAGHGVKIDDFFVGSGFAPGTRVTATAAAALYFNATISAWSAGNISVTVSANRDFYDLPTDWGQAYSIKLLRRRTTLYPAQRRSYDRAVYDEFTTDNPQWYDLFGTYQRNKIRLLPPPGAIDVLQLRYYRAMAAAASITATAVLDMPTDYDYALIAWAKWHFLTDKGNAERATTWLSLAQEGLKQMMSEQTALPDEDLGFTPAMYLGRTFDINSTRNISWDWSH